MKTLLCEGIGITPLARALGVSKSTVLRKLKFLGELSETTFLVTLSKGKEDTTFVQFDEMETSLRTQCLPITIAFAVRPKNGHIVAFRIGEVPCKGGLGRLSKRKYGTRPNQQEEVIKDLLRDLKYVVKDPDNFTIHTDRNALYMKWVRQALPFAKYRSFSGKAMKQLDRAMARVDERGELVDYSTLPEAQLYWIKKQKNGKVIARSYDPIFRVNQKCAVLRSRLSRLRKHTWGFTQKLRNLEYHLAIFAVHHNGYKLPKRRSVRRLNF